MQSVGSVVPLTLYSKIVFSPFVPFLAGRMELGAAAQSEVDQHESLLESYEKRKHARNIVVPTDDGQVKLDLRSYVE